MTVASTQSYIEYAGDGSTKAFAIPFKFLLNSDISAVLSDADGNISTPTNGYDFSVTGAGGEGGTATFNNAYASGYSLLLYRDPPATQETKYYENGKFPAASHEAALDKLTMLIQELGWKFDSLALKRPSVFASYYDAQQNRIANVATPKDAGDAVNKTYADAIGSGSNSYTDQQLLKESQIREAADNLERDARAEADANFQRQLSGEVPLEASAFSVISWHDQTVDNSLDIPANKNAWSFGPQVTISPGQVINVGESSTWTIANGQEYEGVNYDLIADNLKTSNGNNTVAVKDIISSSTGVVSLEHGGSGASTANEARANFGLGNSATLNVGTSTGTVAAGDDARFAGRLIAIKRIPATAVYTPSAGLSFAIVKIVSGGGAGASVPAQSSTTTGTGSGGSSGSVAEVLLTAAQIGISQTVTIGKGGAAVTDSSGGSGGLSSFGALISCPGGLGGLTSTGISTSTAYTAIATPAQQAEPTVNTGVVLLSLAPNTGDFGECHTTIAVGGRGGSSPFGIGGRGSGAAGNAATGKGAGGGAAAVAASGTAKLGGAGTDGYALIYEYAGV